MCNLKRVEKRITCLMLLLIELDNAFHVMISCSINHMVPIFYLEYLSLNAHSGGNLINHYAYLSLMPSSFCSS